jgi:hypothetical protein
MERQMKRMMPEPNATDSHKKNKPPPTPSCRKRSLERSELTEGG